MNDLPLPDLPVPDLDGSRTWRVRASAFRDPVGDAERVAVALGLDLAEAQRLVASAPVVIGKDMAREEAERIASALAEIGAKVLLEDATAAAPRAIASTQSSRPPSRNDSPAADEDDPPARSFWAELPMAFFAPLLGRGALAIAGCGCSGTFAWLLAAYVPGILKLAGVTALVLITLGMIMEIFAKLAQAAASRDPGALPAPHIRMPEKSELFVRGLSTVLVLVVFGTLFWLVSQAGLPPFFHVVVAVAIGAYWPMGLAIQGVSGRFLGVFDVLSAARSIAIAPLEYGAVVVVSCLLLVSLALVVVLGGAVAFASGSAVFAIPLVFLYFGALTYVHGVLGYAMGALIASKEDRFEFLVA